MNGEHAALKKIVGSIVSGGLLGLPFVWPPSFVVVFFALVPLLLLLCRDCGWRRAFLVGWLTGMLATIVGFHWVASAAAHLQAGSLSIALPAFALFVAWHGLKIGLFAAALPALRWRAAASETGCCSQAKDSPAYGVWRMDRGGEASSGNGRAQATIGATHATVAGAMTNAREVAVAGSALRIQHSALLLAAWWVVVEWGFPAVIPWWLGNTLASSPWLRQAADLGGVHLLGFGIVFVNVCLARAVGGFAPSVRFFTAETSRRGEIASGHEPDVIRDARAQWVALSSRESRVVRARGLLSAPPRLCGQVLRRLPFSALGVVLAVLAVWLGYGIWRCSGGAPAAALQRIDVAVVQGNLAADSGYIWPAEMDGWPLYAELTKGTVDGAGARPQLVIWPETVVRGFLRSDEARRRQLQELAGWSSAALFVGAWDRSNGEGGTFNSGYLIASGARGEAHALRTYHKQRLLAFGEYVPLWARWLLPSWHTSSSFVPAAAIQHALPLAGGALAPSICFEAIWPGAMNRMIREGAALLVNITDDGWFAGTIAPQQHLSVARMRSVETRRWMARASNSGISAFIDPLGEIREQVPFGKSGVLRRHIELRSTATVYTALGDWILLLSAGVLLRYVFARR